MEWLTILMVFVVAVLCLCKVLMKREKKEERERERFVIPRGSWGWPLIGETLEFIACGYTSRPVTFMEKRKSLYGDVFRTHILGKAIVVSTDPSVNKVILQNHGNAFIPCYPKSITELLGKSSILQTNGSLHKRVHALIGVFLKSPQFKTRITKDIERAVQLSLSSWTDKNCQVYVQDETRKTKTAKFMSKTRPESACACVYYKLSLSSWTDKNCQVYVQDETRQITFEILVRVLLSIGPGEEMNLLKREFEEFIKGLICIPINLPGTRLYKSLKAKERLLKIVNKVIEKRKMAMEKGEEKELPNDAVDVLLRDADEMLQYGLPLDFISGNIIEMMIPGEETVPTAMTLAVKFLVDSPLALAQFVGENMELKTRKDQSRDEYSWTDYMSLQFTQNVINETLRLANIINAIWRKSLKDVKIKGFLIPKGWCVLASLSSVHMDENNYENPFEFDPWRWKKIGASVSSNIFTPFGGGQRLCPGLELSRLEIAIFLHHLATTYRWTAEKDEIIYFPTVRMKRKLPIAVTPLH